MKRKHRRHQPRVDGGRIPLPSCVVQAIQDRVDHLARRFGVSRSWVVAQLLAEQLNIPFVDRFDTPIKPRP